MQTDSFAALLEQGALLMVGLGVLWLLALLGAGAVEVLSGGRLRALLAVGCPAPWRPVLLGVLGVALTCPAAVARGTGEEQPDPWLPLPVRTVDEVELPRAESPGPATRSTVVVRPGDTLWRIASRGRHAAGRPAGSAAVAARVASLHALNRAVIGPDPDLIHPGQRLALPPTPSGDPS